MRRWFRLNPSLSCLWSDLAVYVPTVTQKHTHSFFISQDEIEPQNTLMSHLVHTHTHTHIRYLHTYTHTLLLSLSFSLLGHGKTLWFLINYGSHLWGNTFITYDRSSKGTVFQLHAEIEMKEIVWLEARQRLQFHTAGHPWLNLHTCAQKAYTTCNFTDII